MPADSKKKNNSVADDARRAAAKRIHLKYRQPWLIFYPTAVAFLLLNYLAFFTTTNEAGTERVLPSYVAAYKTGNYKHAVPGTSSEESALHNGLLFFEETVMGFLYKLGVHWFRSLFGIQAVCMGAWLIHFFELGMCSRICFSCNATAGATALAMFCTALAGFAQLVPIMKARNEWREKVEAAAAGTANGTSAAKESKKEK